MYGFTRSNTLASPPTMNVSDALLRPPSILSMAHPENGFSAFASWPPPGLPALRRRYCAAIHDRQEPAFPAVCQTLRPQDHLCRHFRIADYRKHALAAAWRRPAGVLHAVCRPPSPAPPPCSRRVGPKALPHAQRGSDFAPSAHPKSPTPKSQALPQTPPPSPPIAFVRRLAIQSSTSD